MQDPEARGNDVTVCRGQPLEGEDNYYTCMIVCVCM